MQRLAARLFVAALLLPLCLAAAAPPSEAIQRFEEFVLARMAEERMPGLSVAFRHGDAVWSRGFGYADLENGVAASADSSYRMASVTKPMTAVAALRLAEEGRLDLDADIRTYVPYFPEKPHTVTMRQLLAHLGGISHYRDYMVEGRIREPRNTKESIGIFAPFDLIAAPGERYAYSSYGYNLAGAAIEAVAGKSYGEAMRELVWEPAGMIATRMDDPAEIIPNRVRGYRLVGGKVKNSEYVDISSRFAAGGTRSTVLDMIRFARAVEEGKLLSEQSRRMMWSPQQTRGGDLVQYGLGWGIDSVNGRFEVDHSGSQQEARTLLVHFPGADLTMAFASNFEDAQLTAYRDRLYYLLTGEVWNPRRYLPRQTDRVLARAAGQMFSRGMLIYQKDGGPLTADRKELDRAFAFVNDLLKRSERDAAAATEAIARGIRPGSGQPLAVAGSRIASLLAGREGSFERAFHLGELAFLGDYIRLYRSDASIPRSQRFGAGTERAILALEEEWEKVWTRETAALLVAGAAGAERFASRVRPEARILPSFAEALVAEAEDEIEKGNHEAAQKAIALALRLHPEHAETTGAAGVLAALGGESAAGERLLRKSISLEPRGYASPGNLSSIGRWITSRDPVAAVRMLRTAVAVHPEDAALHVTLGEAWRQSGEKTEAEASFRRALAIDPSSEAAKEGLERLAVPAP